MTAALAQGDTTMVISPNAEFFKYFNNGPGGGKWVDQPVAGRWGSPASLGFKNNRRHQLPHMVQAVDDVRARPAHLPRWGPGEVQHHHRHHAGGDQAARTPLWHVLQARGHS